MSVVPQDQAVPVVPVAVVLAVPAVVAPVEATHQALQDPVQAPVPVLAGERRGKVGYIDTECNNQISDYSLYYS
jgi:hypothetical protein